MYVYNIYGRFAATKAKVSRKRLSIEVKET